MIELLKALGSLGAALGFVAALYGLGDRIGYRWVWKYEFDQAQYAQDYRRLRDRVRDRTATDFQKGVFCGLAQTLKEPSEGLDCAAVQANLR